MLKNELIINKNDLKDNINKILNYEKKDGYNIIAVVKGNGYGCDIVKYSFFLKENGVKIFAVASIDEGLKLRENGFDMPIMILTPYKSEDEIETLIKNDIILSIDSFEECVKVSNIAKKLNMEVSAQISIDTGLNRFGFKYDTNVKKIIQMIENNQSNINFIGIYSHFSNSLAADESYSKLQFERFQKVISDLEEEEINFKLKHICNSSGFFKYKYAHLNAARIGSGFVGQAVPKSAKLNKIGLFHTKIIDVRNVLKGEPIGYANSFIAKNNMRIGIVPTGYFEGIGKTLEDQRFKFLSKSKRAVNSFEKIFKKDYLKLGKYDIIRSNWNA